MRQKVWDYSGYARKNTRDDRPALFRKVRAQRKPVGVPVRLSSNLNVRAERNSQRALSGGQWAHKSYSICYHEVHEDDEVFFNLIYLCVLRALRGDFSSPYNPGWGVAFKAAIYFLRLEGLLP